MSLDDEDINQVFPCRLEDYELGVRLISGFDVAEY